MGNIDSWQSSLVANAKRRPDAPVIVPKTQSGNITRPTKEILEQTKCEGMKNCPECEGQGWVLGSTIEPECCRQSEWECGASGCTGPTPVQVPVQEQCGTCGGHGLVKTESANGE